VHVVMVMVVVRGAVEVVMPRMRLRRDGGQCEDRRSRDDDGGEFH
jgi:hypothetical protein